MKSIIYVMAMLVLITSVTATSGSDYDVVVDCGDNYWWNPISKYCEANELQGNFNQVTSLIKNTDDYISENEARWSSKRSLGLSWKTVEEYLFGQYFDMLKDLFVTKDDLALSEARIMTNNGETGSVNCYASILRAGQTQRTYIIGNSKAYPGIDVCFKVE